MTREDDDKLLAEELEALPDRIHEAEEELAALDTELADPAFYAKPEAHVAERTKHRAALAQQVADLYARWEELDSI